MGESVWDKMGRDGPENPLNHTHPLGKREQDAIAPYGNIKKLLQEMDAPPEHGATDDVGKKLSSMMTGITGINDAVASKVNDALATEDDRKFVIKMAYEHPKELSAALDEMKTDPTQATRILQALEEKFHNLPKIRSRTNREKGQ